MTIAYYLEFSFEGSEFHHKSNKVLRPLEILREYWLISEINNQYGVKFKDLKFCAVENSNVARLNPGKLHERIRQKPIYVHDGFEYEKLVGAYLEELIKIELGAI
mgnify:FL=1